MDLRSGTAFWPTKEGLLANYPRLEQDLQCDVLIIGGGITGALIGYLLVKEGINVITVDRRNVASGSTSASTALLQYEIDTPLIDLTTMVGKEHAERAYRLCYEAIDKMGVLTRELNDDCGYKKVPSLYYASNKRDVNSLKDEYQARKMMGLDLDFWDSQTLHEHFGISAPAALYSKDAAQVNPYRLTHKLLEASQKLGARIFDQNEIAELESGLWGVKAVTAEDYTILANRVVFATGYETQNYLKTKVVDLKSSYAIVSEPLERFEGWFEQALVWESARPYTYARTTEDKRAMIGGEDIPFRNVNARDALLARKTVKLEGKFKELFPSIPFKTAYSWTGTFGETKDGLAYIGETEEYPRAYFALGYGGNGITYSMIGAEIIRDLFMGKENTDRYVFRFGR